MTEVDALLRAIGEHLARHEPWSEFAEVFQKGTCDAQSDPFVKHLSTQTAGQWIDAALRSIDSPLAAQLRAALPMLHWRQNPTYTDADFLARYAYCELLGPESVIQDERVTAGLLCLAPETHYPAHSHPAEEVYHVLIGESLWQRGDERWTRRATGARIHHPSRVPHAMRALTEPLIALYLWRGDIAEPARLR
jgi:quercetin dioxygenase-like cupin family protein